MEANNEAIERYLLGNMDENEKKKFEDRLQKDPALARDLKEQSDILLGIRDHFDSALKSSLQKSDQPEKEGSPKQVRLKLHKKYRWSIAAAIAIAVAATIFFLFPDQSQQNLFASYYDDYPNIVELQQRDKGSTLSHAFAQYDNEQWLVALEAFTDLITENPDLVYPRFYRALCSMNLNQPAEAITDLQWVVEHENTPFTEPASWYLALAHLQSGNKSQTIRLLNDIRNSESLYQEDANALLQDLQ